MDNSKIIQVISINHDVFAVYLLDENVLIKDRVSIVAVLDSGDICYMVSDPSGDWYCPQELSNFIGYEFDCKDGDFEEEIMRIKNRRVK